MNWTNVRQALVVGFVAGVLALIAFFLHAGTFFGVDFHAVVNAFGLAALSAISVFLTGLGTTKRGKFLGAVSVKDVY